MNELAIETFLFFAGFAFLTGGAELLVRGASRLAAAFNIPSVVIGLTVVAFGTSLPELLVSMIANLQSSGGSDIAIGNIVGSNIANLALILGLAAVMTAIPVERHLLRREYPILLITSILFVALAWNGVIHRWEGVLFIAGLIGFTYYSYAAERIEPVEAAHALDVVGAIDKSIAQPSRRLFVDSLLVLVGLVGLIIGANWLIESAQVIARALGVSDLVIGLTLVAIGTSLPELATTVIAVMRKEADIAVGNVVGSNIFNILFIGGLSAIIRPLAAPPSMHSFDFPVMLGLTVLVYVLASFGAHRLSRWQGLLLLALYVGYVGWLFV